MSLIVRAEFLVTPQHVAAFLAVAGKLARAASAEPGTLRYSWYTTADPQAFVVIEEYTDGTAALAHNDACAALLQEAGALATMTVVQLHGDLGPELRVWVAQHPHATAHQPLDV